MASDPLPCGCSARLVAAAGHYHEDDDAPRRSCSVDQETLERLREDRTARRLWQAQCDVCGWYSDGAFADQDEADAAARRHHMRAHSPAAS